ncbi:chemotaxis response regulator protein-glutamate methylesterase [Pseudomonas sp. ZM23]|uniref:Protein-glutamate methylesterase/protein-glutamine glutaminase n=1 Tax=Pseudomonas triclosanedens TaxID=2961893 RepID=A0ABY6ZWG8_9PSED|nr:chemotaxis response regulator protein-glutamate methylesterase [Pseudomonas triclosanedens]MCP8463479.1 chemotaxis response regulator protein-glutamate methylesterase [Pseudomonas triclosanedens]MCP8469462.1 chemotaxis response regulator protein-glutamate methylesterase [Pseudomonas triclosanedens]MCP8474280.1 chemotaxis response regulator protein-glutamate methylesterase [Pseudomonas triclosanedens]WAI48333.1 chemotaxis response regulator protein-glutamate methylesterase [Pseudomonas triclo
MKVGIVNDMPLAVEAMRRALAFEPAHRVVWVAANGAEAIEMCAAQKPDVVLMDLLMPVMDGVEATRRIMAQSPCAIIVVTVDLEQNMTRVFDAMGHGAVDAVNTPAIGAGDAYEAARPLLRKLQNLAWLNAPRDARPSTNVAPPRKASGARQLVAIGSSAGGPAALAELFAQLPETFPAAIVVVQHVDEVFAAGMAEWLSTQSRIPVRLARHGEPPQPGCVLLAGTNHHIRLLRSGELAYTAEPSSHIYRPSIDVFFDSVVENWSGDAVGVLLTGMGRDGAEGLKHMRERGFLTLAQDQGSSAVYGMPKAAAAIGAAVEIRALGDIASRLADVCG